MGVPIPFAELSPEAQSVNPSPVSYRDRVAETGHRPTSGSLEPGTLPGASPWEGDNCSNKVSSWKCLQMCQGFRPPFPAILESWEGRPNFHSLEHSIEEIQSSQARRKVRSLQPDRWILTSKPSEGLGWSQKKLTVTSIKHNLATHFCPHKTCSVF